jgi:two-component system chemotaxis sensor kinase CheA
MTNGAAIALENARLLEQTQTQAAELRQANKVKNEFLGFVSHELRTPVNVIMGYAAILQNKMLGEINPEQDNALEKMSVNSKGLLNMIEQLLEATKIEAGAAVAQIAEVNLSDFIEELRSAYTVPLKKPIRLDWNYPGDLPVIRTDAEKLRHVLLNVIGNAVKYTQQGGVTVSVRVQEGERREATGDRKDGGGSLSPRAFIEFDIADTGIGIPKDELPRIFEMFSQVKGARYKSGGVGLGLHIVKKFTELLGGDIRVTSEEGQGSTFTITIPTGTDEHRPGDNQDLRTEGSPDARASADIDPPFPPSET